MYSSLKVVCNYISTGDFECCFIVLLDVVGKQNKNAFDLYVFLLFFIHYGTLRVRGRLLRLSSTVRASCAIDYRSIWDVSTSACNSVIHKGSVVLCSALFCLVAFIVVCTYLM